MHRYALAIGWPVPLLEKLLSSQDIAEAMAFDRLEPFGEKRADLRAGIVASVIANANVSKKGNAFSPQDFMPTFAQPNGKRTHNDDQLINDIKEVFGIGDFSKPSH